MAHCVGAFTTYISNSNQDHPLQHQMHLGEGMLHLSEGTNISASVFITTCTDYNMKQKNNLTLTSAS